jgi:hypothetical protein
MDFSSLVLVERDKDTKLIKKELGSYEVVDGAEYITNMFYDGEKVNVYFDTNKDVEEWEYSAIFDLFDLNKFEVKGYIIEEIENEYNPTWLIKFDYSDEYDVISNNLNELCGLIKGAIVGVFEDIKGKNEEYK